MKKDFWNTLRWLALFYLMAYATFVWAQSDPSNLKGEQTEISSEDLIFQAMQSMADILKAHPDDPDAAISEIKAYLDKNEARLRKAALDINAHFEKMSSEEQDAYLEKKVSRPEYQAWSDAYDAFEDKFPSEKTEQLDLLMDRLLTMGTEQTTSDAEINNTTESKPEEKTPTENAEQKQEKPELPAEDNAKPEEKTPTENVEQKDKKTSEDNAKPEEKTPTENAEQKQEKPELPAEDNAKPEEKTP